MAWFPFAPGQAAIVVRAQRKVARSRPDARAERALDKNALWNFFGALLAFRPLRGRSARTKLLEAPSKD